MIVVEVGPRDGLQNEPTPLPTAQKIELINRLSKTGLLVVEATSFVRPDVIPQLADATEVMTGIERFNNVMHPVLVPNLRGYERARECKPSGVAVFTAASETFCQKNINSTIADSIELFRPVVEAAKADGVPVRGYISMAFGCPYEGTITPSQVHAVAQQLVDIGVSDLSIGDTIGVAVPAQLNDVCVPIIDMVGIEHIGLHLHDTRGTALANIWRGLELGIVSFDSSIAGLGGCPFADGATGNIATEDVVWFLERNGVRTGVDLDALIDVARWISAELGRVPSGHIATSPRWPS